MSEEDNTKIAQLEARIAKLEETHRILAEGIPPFASQASGVSQPFRAGSNTYTLANPSSGSTDTVPTATSTTTLSNKSHDSTINFTGTSATATAGSIVSPGNFQGFIIVMVSGTARKIPYFAT